MVRRWGDTADGGTFSSRRPACHERRLGSPARMGKIKDLCIAESDAHIVIQSQTCSGCEFDKFAAKYKLSVVTYELSTFPEQDPNVARNELVACLDCMSVADVLITSGGGFSDLAAALLHDEGRSLNLHWDTHTDVPNAIHASDFTGSTV